MIDRYWKSYGIRKIFAGYAFALIAVLLSLSISLINLSGNSLVDYVMLHAKKNCDLLQTAIAQMTNQIDTFYYSLQYNESFTSIMRAERYAQLSPKTIKKYHCTKSSLPASTELSISTDLVTSSDIFLSQEIAALNDRMPLTKKPIPLGIQIPVSPLVKSPQITFGYNYFVRGERIGTVYISLDTAQLLANIPITQDAGQYYILADSQRNIVFLNDSGIEPDAKAAMLKEIQDYDPGRSHRFWDHLFNRFILQSTQLDNTDCTLYAIIDRTIIKSPLKHMYSFTLSFLVILAVILLSSSLFFRHAIIMPLSEFGRYINRLRTKSNILLQPTPTFNSGGCPEIQAIEQEFAALIESISTLSSEIQQKNKDLHQAELLYKNSQIAQLRSQINPHFLYNTLELIRADAISGKIDQVSSITASMGKLYRYSIKGEPIVPLSQELEMIKAYLHIQKSRFNGEISVLYNIAKESLNIRIPKMILQPLAENAIVHGLEPAGGHGTIFIGTAVQDGCLTISVRDDGLGIPPERLAQIQMQLDAPEKKTDSLGVVNVYTRLMLQYGPRCQFSITSSPNDGTCITIRLPEAM